MLDFTKFYNDLEFVAALYYNNMLTNQDIYDIANKMINSDPDEKLIDILVATNETDKNLVKFGEYIKTKNISFKDPQRFLIKKIFQYILKMDIALSDGIKYINFKILNSELTKKYVGDYVGIEQIIGNFWAIEDGDVTDSKNIQILEDLIKKDMLKYIEEN